MIEFQIKNPLKLYASKLEKGLFIWIFHANKIPPHIGISIDGHFYSLKVTNKDLEVDYKRVIDIINQKKIQTIFVEINNLDLNIKEKIDEIFTKTDVINNCNSSCLIPLIKVLVGVNSLEIERLSQLLVNLQNQDRIQAYFQLNLDPDFEGIQFYTKEKIQQRIEELIHVKRRKHLPKSH
jgi:hypothetical protein